MRTATIIKFMAAAATSVALVVAPLTSVSAATVSPTIKESQTIMKKFGLPVGTIDGMWGPQTARGLCAFRQIASLPWSRATLNQTDLAWLRAYNLKYSSLGQITQTNREGKSTYMLANETCQTMTYVKANRIVRVMPISTGTAGHATPNGLYTMGSTRPGWSCSTLYPESCGYHTEGMNAKYNTKGVLYSRYGNMYNKRSVNGNILVHGSTSVPTYPASHGCIRVTVADSDWMWRYVDPMPIMIRGQY